MTTENIESGKIKVAVRMADGSKQLYKADADIDHAETARQIKDENQGAATILVEVACTRPMVDQVAA